MLPKLSELPKIPLVIVIFIGIIAIETLVLTVFGLLFNVNLGLHGPNWIMLSIAVGLSGWLLTLGVYLFISALTDVYPDSLKSRQEVSCIFRLGGFCWTYGSLWLPQRRRSQDAHSAGT